ncbi:MAG TPA: ABC transporter ATP-binding protein [Candidatus Limnocylindria bacterium]|nr:ABC transporter ATP-binding protein [Candidatus Limnocylindria bacterium]
MASVELKSVGKVFRPKNGQEVHAVRNLNLHVANKELIVLVGPSGCGKTTTLRLIGGLEEATTGTISFNGTTMNSVSPQDRDVAMVFQNHALYPHMTVFENMAFGLTLRKIPSVEIKTRVQETASMLGIAPLLERFPRALSGGQRQRVALGRALARQPKVFLLDEPLSNLDTPMRTEMRTEISRLHQRLGATMLYVTHDQSEAMTLGQRIVVMNEGVVQQVAEPFTLYHQPANLFVAGFIGSPPMNLFQGRVTHAGGQWVFQENNPAGATNGSRLEFILANEQGEKLARLTEGAVVLGFRPEHISWHDGAAQEQTIPRAVELIELLGPETHLHFNTSAHRFIVRTNTGHIPRISERVALHFDLTKAIFFDPVSEAAVV